MWFSTTLLKILQMQLIFKRWRRATIIVELRWLLFQWLRCGNEFKTEAPMARKFVLDYLKYWVQEFGIDGFRFDLMGAMDYDSFRKSTMN